MCIRDRWLSLEYERRWHPDDIPDASIGMKKSIDYLKSILLDVYKRQYADFEDGLHQMQVLDKIFESAKTGRWISVN